MLENWSVVAQTAYETYAQIVRADAQLLPVPEWEELPPRLQEGWRQAVKRASEMLPEEVE